MIPFAEQILRDIEAARPCLDADTTDAELAAWCRETIIPALVNATLI